MKKTIPIKKNYEFQKLYKKGKFYVAKYIVIYILENKRDYNRLGISITAKYGKSVQRNRIKRLIKENYRLYEDFLKSGYDSVIVARKNDDEVDFNMIKKEMKYLYKKLNVFDQEKWECFKKL